MFLSSPSEGWRKWVGGASTLRPMLSVSQVTKSMAGVVKSMDATLKTMNLEKVRNAVTIPACVHQDIWEGGELSRNV